MQTFPSLPSTRWLKQPFLNPLHTKVTGYTGNILYNGPMWLDAALTATTRAETETERLWSQKQSDYVRISSQQIVQLRRSIQHTWNDGNTRIATVSNVINLPSRWPREAPNHNYILSNTMGSQRGLKETSQRPGPCEAAYTVILCPFAQHDQPRGVVSISVESRFCVSKSAVLY